MFFSYTHANKTQKYNHKMNVITITIKIKKSFKIIGLFYDWSSLVTIMSNLPSIAPCNNFLPQKNTN